MSQIGKIFFHKTDAFLGETIWQQKRKKKQKSSGDVFLYKLFGCSLLIYSFLPGKQVATFISINWKPLKPATFVA